MAGGLRAGDSARIELIYLTDVGGVLGRRRQGIAPHELRLSIADAAHRLIEEGTASGGMEAKLRAAMAAVQTGAERVRIVSGAEPEILPRLLAGEDIGTTLVA